MKKIIFAYFTLMILSFGCGPRPKPVTPVEKASKLQKVVVKTDSVAKKK